jgi:hypothetical protein
MTLKSLLNGSMNALPGPQTNNVASCSPAQKRHVNAAARAGRFRTCLDQGGAGEQDPTIAAVPIAARVPVICFGIGAMVQDSFNQICTLFAAA